jgi:hypothetical protein
MTLDKQRAVFADKRIGWAAVAAASVLIAFLIFYCASPYFAAGALASALRTGDQDRLQQLIDFPSVRQNLKDDLKAQMVSKVGSDRGLTAVAALLAPTFVDRFVDSMVTPSMIATAVKNGEARRASGGSTSVGGTRPDIVSQPRGAYAGLNRFRILSTLSDGSTIAFVMSRQGLFGWRVTRMELPPDMLNPKPALAGPSDAAVSSSGELPPSDAPAPAAVAASAFSLACSGTQASGTYNAMRGTSYVQSERPFQTLFSVNPESGRWCEAACTSSSPIFSMTDTEYVLWQQPNALLKPTPRLVINRESGQMQFLRRDNGSFVSMAGTCTRIPYRGMPETQF